MTLYTAFELSPPSWTLADGAPVAAPHAAADLDGLDAPALGLLSALFDADGATPDALGTRVYAPREAVDGLLGRLGQLGYVERDGEAAWMTGEAFGLRDALRRSGERVAVPFDSACH